MSNAWATCPVPGNSRGKPRVTPGAPPGRHLPGGKGDGTGWARVPSARRRGDGPPWRRRVAGVRAWTATLGLRHGPDSYGRQQWGILRNGRKPDAATPRAGRRPPGRKPLSAGTIVTVPAEEAPANYVPAAAVIRRGRALSGFIGRKARVGGPESRGCNAGAQPPPAPDTAGLGSRRGRRNSRCSGGMRRYREEHRWRRRPSGRRPTLRRESRGSEQD